MKKTTLLMSFAISQIIGTIAFANTQICIRTNATDKAIEYRVDFNHLPISAIELDYKRREIGEPLRFDAIHTRDDGLMHYIFLKKGTNPFFSELTLMNCFEE